MTIVELPDEERIAEAIRGAGIKWHKEKNPEWRDKPYMDGILVDLDEDDVLIYLTYGVIRALRGNVD